MTVRTGELVPAVTWMASEGGRRVSAVRGTQVGRGPDCTVPAMVSARAESTPDRLAIVHGRDRLSYRELDRRANQFANHLAACGIERGDRVGVALRRTVWLPIALIGTMRAGASYVPLPYGTGWRAVAALRAFAACRAVACETATLDAIGPGQGVPIVLEQHVDLLAGACATAPAQSVHPSDEAYVVFTSGTTGRPKGVVVSHGALGNAVAALGGLLQLGSNDRVAHHTPMTFDIAAFELFAPLVHGATLKLCAGDLRSDPVLLASELVDPQLTVVHATPAGWQILLELGWSHAHVKIWCGGEALRPELNRLLHSRAREVWHVYGPSETTLDSTARRTTPNDDPVSVGPPIANTDVFIVDEGGHLCDVGEPGEVVIGGAGVADAYLADPTATARRFIPAPLTGERAYATGDLGLLDTGGSLQLIGRIDLELKIGGRRVNLAELDLLLDRWPGVRDGAVTSRSNGRSLSLVAFVVPDPEAAFDSVALEQHLRESVPGLRAPISVVVLDSLPLSANGKIDRTALPTAAAIAGNGTVTDEVEHRLVGIWRELLDQPTAGTCDDFFALGGDSLGSVRIAARAREEGFEVAPTDVLRLRTVAALAKQLRGERA